MKTPIQLSNAAVVFTDSVTGQGYVRVLNAFEATLVSAQLAALDDGEMKAIPVYPLEIRKMSKEGK